MTDWNIIKVKPGMELVAHEVLVRQGFEVWTPIEIKRQLVRRRSRQEAPQHIHYAVPMVAGWLFIRFDQSDEMKYKLKTLLERRDYLYSVLICIDPTGQESLYRLPESDIEAWKDYFEGLRRDGAVKNTRNKGVVPEGYDISKHSRKNRQKRYAQGPIAEIIFEPGTDVTFESGAWGGLTFPVEKQSGEKVTLKGDFMGQVTSITAYAHDLRMAG